MKLISPKIRESAKGEHCTLRLPGVCNFDPATTVFAHIPCGRKGMGMKNFDPLGAYACSCCHDVIDGRVLGEFNSGDLLRALAETLQRLIEKGLVVIVGEKEKRHRATARPSKILPRCA